MGVRFRIFKQKSMLQFTKEFLKRVVMLLQISLIVTAMRQRVEYWQFYWDVENQIRVRWRVKRSLARYIYWNQNSLQIRSARAISIYWEPNLIRNMPLGQIWEEFEKIIHLNYCNEKLPGGIPSHHQIVGEIDFLWRVLLSVAFVSIALCGETGILVRSEKGKNKPEC